MENIFLFEKKFICIRFMDKAIPSLYGGFTLYNDIVIQIDGFLCIGYECRQIKPGKRQLKNHIRTGFARDEQR